MSQGNDGDADDLFAVFESHDVSAAAVTTETELNLSGARATSTSQPLPSSLIDTASHSTAKETNIHVGSSDDSESASNSDDSSEDSEESEEDHWGAGAGESGARISSVDAVLSQRRQEDAKCAQVDGGSSAMRRGESSGGALSIIASPAYGAKRDEEAQDSATARQREATELEPRSGIRVRRRTAMFEQLHIWFAQYPYATFQNASALLKSRAAAPSPPSSSVSSGVGIVGVVCRRFDPKESARQKRYAVVRVWDMKLPGQELAVLLLGAAFEHFYNKLVVGTVVACHVSPHPPSSSGERDQQRDAQSGDLVKVSELGALRILGYAADLGTCEATNQHSNERCHNLVNRTLSNYCSFHITGLRSVARGSASASHPQSASKFPLNSAASRPLGSTPNSSAVQTLPIASMARSIAAIRGSGSVSAPSPLPKKIPAKSAPVMRHHENYLVSRGPGVVFNSANPRPTTDLNTDVSYAGLSKGIPLVATDLQQRGAIRQALPTAAQLGVTQKGRQVLDAAAEQERRERQRRLLSDAMRGSAAAATTPAAAAGLRTPMSSSLSTAPASSVEKAKRPRSSTALDLLAADGDISKGDAWLTALPTSRRSVIPSSFAPLSCRPNPRFDEVVMLQPGRTTNTARACAGAASGSSAAGRGHGALVDRVAQALRSDEKLLRAAKLEKAKEAGDDGPATGTRRPPAASPTTLIGRVASSLSSSNEALRVSSEVAALHKSIDKLVEQEQALNILSQVTEQRVQAVHCYTCRTWYFRRPRDCIAAQHRMIVEETVKRFIQCRNCHFKTYVLGDMVPSVVMPTCQRCHTSSGWDMSNAAPELAQPKEIAFPR